MNTRSANATLKGYFYQFDKTILTILNSTSSGVITIEGIEDIDVSEQAASYFIQCKYLESETYAPSLLRKPIIYFLEHFIKSTSRIKYYLYVFFGVNQSSLKSFDLDSIKSFLTYTEDGKQINFYSEKGLSDSDLTEFLDCLIIQEGKNYEDQQKELLEVICKEFKCKQTEAEEFYYNKALRVVTELAIQKDITNRKITKSEFIKKVNTKQILFNMWFYELEGEDRYQKQIKAWIDNCDGLNPQKDKFIFLERSYLTQQPYSMNFVQLVNALLNKFYSLGKSLSKSRPLTFILDASEEEIKKIKVALLKEKIRFNDGYEAIEFSFDFFNDSPLIYKTKSDKITNSSYLIRLASANTYLKNKQNLLSPDCVFYFSSASPTNFFEEDICLIQIYGKKLEDIKSIFN